MADVPRPIPPASRSSLSSQIKELVSEEDDDTSKSSAEDSDDFSSDDEEMEEVFNKLGEFAGIFQQHKEEFAKIEGKFKKHEEIMNQNLAIN